MGSDVEAYLDYALKTAGIQRHRFLRELFALSRRVTEAIFARTLQRALRYRVTHIETLQRIAWFCISQSDQQLPEADVDDSFRQRPAYQEGCLTDEPDLSVYDDLLPDDDETDDDAGSQPDKDRDDG